MHRLLFSCLEALAAGVFLIPAFLLLNKKYNWGKITVPYLIFGLYLSAGYALAGLPNVTYIRFEPHFNLVPFLYMFSDLTNSILNVILFFPLGFLLPVLWKRYKSFLRTLLFGFSMSLFIEVFQIFTLRATDVNDLITNTFGTLLGYLLGRLILIAVPKITPDEDHKDLYRICGVTFSVMFFLQPFLSALLWNIIYAL